MLKAKGGGGKGRFKPWDVGRHHQYEFRLVQEGIMRTQDHIYIDWGNLSLLIKATNRSAYNQVPTLWLSELFITFQGIQ